MSAACRPVINLNDYLAPFGAELSRGVARRAMAAMGRLKARSGRVSIMQHARSSYASLLGSVGRCGTTATAEVTEGAVTFWKNYESRVGVLFHLPKIWQPHRGMKHVCVAECPRPMPVIHLEVGQQAVRSREWFDNNRLKALKWYPASARWRAWTFATHAPKGPSFAGPRTSSLARKIRCPRCRITHAPAAESPSPTLAGSRGSLSQREPCLPPLRPPN